ncbi:chemotaxis protein CheW [Halobacteriovorax sp. GB3]|uniref:chemotaxis protein CheW n=1 Tax=Halobacteriovorax sp. GB3 TaxID=2719615 RepID=UPI002361CDB1|nr:chemotaxis protein CheW [Halobacteriovorax sp. GB3]MDD0853785.1 chemotaxis protein CheW [Halobacteriovorax sp. GB3]
MADQNLAKLEKNETSNYELQRFLEFSLGEEDYAIPLLSVREVISVPETTPIPKAPAHFLGIMNLRGQVISVVDLRTKLKIKPLENNSEESVIIVDINGMNLGIVVDSINKVLAFQVDEINEVPEIESQVNAEYIQGVYRKEDSLTVLLDVAKVLDLKDKTFVKKAA